MFNNTIDLTQSATKGYADISAYMHELGNLSSNMKSQQILKLLNHKVILDGLLQLQGLNTKFDEKIHYLHSNVSDALEKKKIPFLKIFSLHILVFVILFFVSIYINPQSMNMGYFIASIGMGVATGILNLMLRRERGKYKINNVFFILEEEKIEQLFPLHKNLSKIIDLYRKDEKEDTLDELNTLEDRLKKEIKILF